MVDEYTRHLERNKEVKGKGLSQFRMKVLADVLLFFSPFSVAVLPHIVGKPSRENMFALSVCVIGEAISWASIPIFAWLLYQGIRMDRQRMALRAAPACARAGVRGAV